MIGKLRQRVKIQTRTKTESYKGVTESWADTETRWASVLDLSKQEQELYQQFGAPGDLKKIVFKGSVSLAVKDNRFVYNSTNYEMIKPPRDTEQLGKYTTVLVKKVVRK